jgi:hypothetical protein
LTAAGTSAATAESAPALELAVDDVAGVAGVALLELVELDELLLLPQAATTSAQSTSRGAKRQLLHLSIKTPFRQTSCPVRSVQNMGLAHSARND